MGCNDISKVNVNKEMIKYCSKAHGNYKAYLLKNRDKKNSTIEAKKEKIREQLQSEKKNKINCAKAYERHMKNADDLALKAQMEEKLSLLKESNESRKRSCDMKECIDVSVAKI